MASEFDIPSGTVPESPGLLESVYHLGEMQYYGFLPSDSDISNAIARAEGLSPNYTFVNVNTSFQYAYADGDNTPTNQFLARMRPVRL